MTLEEEIRSTLKPLLGKVASKCFVADYKATEQECLGLVVSKYLEWDSRIVRTCYEALEDANFHDLSAAFSELATEKGFGQELGEP
jgi:hypothetical protein